MEERPIKPRTWLPESIIATLLCCLPLGIVGIVYAARVNSLYNAGDYEGAENASKKAGQFTKLSAIIGIVYIVIYSIYLISKWA